MLFVLRPRLEGRMPVMQEKLSFGKRVRLKSSPYYRRLRCNRSNFGTQPTVDDGPRGVAQADALFCQALNFWTDRTRGDGRGFLRWNGGDWYQERKGDGVAGPESSGKWGISAKVAHQRTPALLSVSRRDGFAAKVAGCRRRLSSARQG